MGKLYSIFTKLVALGEDFEWVAVRVLSEQSIYFILHLKWALLIVSTFFGGNFHLAIV